MATVLVVDDEPLMLTLVTHVLQQNGFSVFAAGGGAQAVSLFRSHSSTIDLLISDIQMPEMDGPTLAAKLQAERPDLPVLLMSGYCDPGHASTDFNFLAKPFEVSELLDRARTLSQLRQTA